MSRTGNSTGSAAAFAPLPPPEPSPLPLMTSLPSSSVATSQLPLQHTTGHDVLGVEHGHVHLKPQLGGQVSGV